MHNRTFLSAAMLAALISVTSATGQTSESAAATPAPDDAVSALRREIAQLRSDYEQRMADLEARLAALDLRPPLPPLDPLTPPTPPTPPDTTGERTPPPTPAGEMAAAGTSGAAPEALAAPVTLLSGAAGRNYLNLSLDGIFAAGVSTASDVEAIQTGGHDPVQRGFTVQNVEMVLEGAVDPYFRGQANVILQISPEGETVVELEEVYATTTALPGGLQVKAGQYFTEFGRLNSSHPHSWDFVDQPLVNGRFFGGDGLRSVGARVSWLLPTEFYSEAFLGIQNSQGETVTSFRSVPGETLFGREVFEREVRSLNDLLLAPRYTASFDLTDSQTLLLGASAALGPNGTGETGETRIYGLDGFWKWKSPNAFKGFPFLKIQGEVMYRDLAADAVPDSGFGAADFEDWGGYLQLNWGYRTGQVAGLRIDRVGGDTGDPGDPALASRLRLSPVWTWFPTEYSKLRLQYNFDQGDAFERDEHSLWLQLEFLLGAHAAHKF